MENLEMVAVENPHYENAVPRYVWDHPDFEDISAWETNQPANENMGGNFGQPDLRESLGVGTEFESKELAIHAVRKWSIMKRVEYVNDTIMSNNIHMTPKYIAKELWDVMTEKLRLSGAEIQARIYKDYGLEISPLKAWQAKQQTMINLFGTWDVSFADLPHLMKALVDHSPETVVKWDTEEIDGVYIQHCRPILSIDGTHMYGKYDAKLLVACSLDANNGVLPVAFPLVESENTSSWSWFMSCIREGVTSRQGFNFNTKVKDSYLKKKIGKVAYAKKEYKFAAHYEELMKLLKDRPDVRTWLRNVDVHLRSLAMDTGALVMFTFKQLNKYFNTRRYRYDNMDSAFAPKVHESHAIGVCKFTNREYSDYVPHEYTLEAYNMTWSYHFSPIPHSDFWEPYDGLPHMPNPHFKRTNVGKNPTRRRRTEMDLRDVGQSSTQGEASSSQPPGRIQRCKLCHQSGHTRRSCPFANAS
ncbi:hypothetical protein QQ045_014924 [Rhodiola kirilowii]